MSEQGIDDFGLAKRKAAERLGATDISVLPRIQRSKKRLRHTIAYLKAKLILQRLSALRELLSQAMRLLDRFEPRLVGPVLSGTASAHSEITLHLFSDGPEPVALHLMDRGVPHRIGERRMRYEPDRLVTYPVVQFVAGDKKSTRSFSRSTVSGSRLQAPWTGGR